MIPGLGPDRDYDFQLLGGFRCRFRCSKMQNPNNYRHGHVMRPALVPDMESDFFSLFEIPDPDSDAVKCGIITPLVRYLPSADEKSLESRIGHFCTFPPLPIDDRRLGKCAGTPLNPTICPSVRPSESGA